MYHYDDIEEDSVEELNEKILDDVLCGYSCDDIEADPMAWEEQMFDEADEYYRKEEAKRNVACCDNERFYGSSDDNTFEDDETEDDTEQFSKEWYEEHFDYCDLPYENWKEYHDWIRVESEEQDAWMKFQHRHLFNITSPGCEPDYYNDWNIDVIYPYWKRWLQSNDKEREKLLDEDAYIFEENHGVKWVDWKAYLSWLQKNKISYLYFWELYYQPTMYLYDIRDQSLEDKIIAWKEWLEYVTKFEDWRQHATPEEIETLKLSVLDGFDNLDNFVQGEFRAMELSEEKRTEICASPEYEKLKEDMLYYAMVVE